MVTPRLVLGPMLRHVDETRATVWVETDAACEVEVRAGTSSGRDRTFAVTGLHYALVVVEGLTPGVTTLYQVFLDGEQVWPEPGSHLPPSEVHALDPARPLRLTFGSCRTSAPHHPPWSRSRLLDSRGRGVDALRSLAQELVADPTADRPDLLLLVGDQVYADENLSPGVLRQMGERRDLSEPPGAEVADWEEYVLLYRDAFSDPLVRWLLATIPCAMIFDDHDVRDDWNTSAAWLERVRSTSWWKSRITGAMMGYWLYQHLGNLPPEALPDDEVFAALRRCAERGEDGEHVLRSFASRADVEEQGRGSDVRWSYRRDLGGTRLVVVDTRAGRVLDRDGRRMLDDAEWDWVADQLTGDVDHLLVASSVPVLMPEAVHHLESWDEAIVAGAWGPRWAERGETIRQGMDLEQWPAFRHSFDLLLERVAEVARGVHGRAPATVLLLSGDIHFGYLASAAPVDGPAWTSRVWQAVSSPIRNPQNPSVRVAERVFALRPLIVGLRALARRAGVPDAAVRWTRRHGPWFGNQLMALELGGARAHAEVLTARGGMVRGRGDGRSGLRRRGRIRLV